MYAFDSHDNSIVISGWENGIAPTPYAGISDARNVFINSIPGEVSVGFSTGSLSAVVSNGTITSVAANVATFTGASGIDGRMAIRFTSVGSYTGITASGTNIYWISALAGSTFKIYSDWDTLNQVSISGSGNAGFTVYNPDFSNYQGNTPNRFCRSTITQNAYVQDSIGQVWSNKILTSNNNYWTYSGNAVHNQAGFVSDHSNGNGICFLKLSSTNTGYIFAFSDSSIDYINDAASSTWVYAWNPGDGTTGDSNYGKQVLNAGKNSGASHDALVGQDNVLYYCDASNVGSFYELSGQNFSPTSTSTYTFSKQALQIPSIDTANCLAELGINLLVGGTRNLIYPWDRISHVSGLSINSSYTYPIWLTESVVQRMVTVNTNTYIFVGNRGRIHVTNGSQAQEWIKIPDHLSGTVEPYYVWGAAVSNKNQLYFSVAAINNDSTGTANTNYGAIWAVDLISKNLRVVNQMSYGSYAGLATALFAVTPLYNGGALVGNPTGAGLFIGWCSGNVQNSGNGIVFSGGSSGIDKTVATPYANSQAYVDSDLIPIGTFTNPRAFRQIEYLLTKPLVSGESITLQYRTDFSQSFTTIAKDSTVGNYANTFPVNWNYSQWIQIRAILNSTATSPSFVRLKSIRITGLVGPTLGSAQQLST